MKTRKKKLEDMLTIAILFNNLSFPQIDPQMVTIILGFTIGQFSSIMKLRKYSTFY
jgi:hypothetical protein